MCIIETKDLKKYYGAGENVVKHWMEWIFLLGKVNLYR